MPTSRDFIDLLIDQLVNDDRLLEKLVLRVVERVGTASGAKPTKWLSVNEAAEYMQVSTDLVYAMVREGTLKCTRLGQLQSRKPTIRFNQNELDAWLAAGGVKARE